MDTAVTVPLIIAIIAIIPGVWALFNQAKKDRIQAQIDMTNVAQAAALNIIEPLQKEVTRLQAKVLELEKMLDDRELRIEELEKSLTEANRKRVSRENHILELEREIGELRDRIRVLEGNSPAGR